MVPRFEAVPKKYPPHGYGKRFRAWCGCSRPGTVSSKRVSEPRPMPGLASSPNRLASRGERCVRALRAGAQVRQILKCGYYRAGVEQAL